MVHIGVRHAGQEIRRARPERRETYSGFAGEPSIDISHEGRALLMPSRDDTNPGIEQCIGKANKNSTPSFSRQRTMSSEAFIMS
jgi:hypothetical protein